MLDDDIESLSRIYTEKGEETHVDPETANDIVQATAYAAHHAGAYLAFRLQLLAYPYQLQQAEPYFYQWLSNRMSAWDSPWLKTVVQP